MGEGGEKNLPTTTVERLRKWDLKQNYGLDRIQNAGTVITDGNFIFHFSFI